MLPEIIHHPITSNNRNASLESIIENFDISTIVGSSKIFNLGARLVNKKTVLFQIDWSGLDDTDAIFKLQRSNNGKTGTFRDIPTLSITLNSAENTDYLEAIDFSAGYIKGVLIKKSVTVGNIGIHVIVKD